MMDPDAKANMLKSVEMQEAIADRAEKFAATLGSGYAPSAVLGRNRVHGSVITATFEARKDNAKRETLLRHMDGSWHNWDPVK